ncbi:MAG: LemA family protein, partial [Lachnospiraceae bacterium]|nr:LemA family protein [Lachnospiraceae bacterium]
MPFVIIGLIVIVLAVAVWWIVTYNNIKVLGLKVKEGLSGIDVALTKRYDVLTKMLDVVKGFQKYEKEVLTQIVELRSGMSIKEKSAANQSMDELHREINVIAEQYPELRSSNTFVELER